MRFFRREVEYTFDTSLTVEDIRVTKTVHPGCVHITLDGNNDDLGENLHDIFCVPVGTRIRLVSRETSQAAVAFIANKKA